jgi:hypothetical protein
VRDRRIEVLRAIDEVDRQLSRLALLAAAQRPKTVVVWSRLDRLLDRRLALTRRLAQLETLGFLVTDRRRVR